jgi:hypothetical protein
MVVLFPLQMVAEAGVTVITGFGFTVTVTVAVFLHPLASVPVTVYVVVAKGLAVTVAPEAGANPVTGLHVYVTAPAAVSVVLLPLHIVTLGETVTVGFGRTITSTVVELLHPVKLVPVTVYVVLTSGFAVTVAPVVADNPAAGLHV